MSVISVHLYFYCFMILEHISQMFINKTISVVSSVLYLQVHSVRCRSMQEYMLIGSTNGALVQFALVHMRHFENI